MNYTDFNYKVFKQCALCESINIKNYGRKGTNDRGVHPQVFKCFSCGVFFVNPIIDIECIPKLYENFSIDYKPHSQERLNFIMSEVQNWDKKIKKSSSNNRTYKFLEIGSARGAFVNSFNKIGWDSYGIEPSEQLFNFSKNQYNLDNIKNEPIEKVEYPDDYFDLIYFWHVLEHLVDPKTSLEKIYKWLRPGGILHLGTPNPNNIITKIYPKITGYFDLGREHTFIFPPKTLNNILKSIGFVVKNHEVYSTRKSGSTIKILIRNILHHIYPKSVSYYQRLTLEKPFNQ